MKFVFVVMAFLTVLAALVGCQKMADLPDCAVSLPSSLPMKFLLLSRID
jgi:hypothetical protein